MPELPTLTGERLVLRAPLDRDAAARLALGRDPEVLRGYGADADGLQPLSMRDCDEWLLEQRSTRSWVIDVGGELAGTVRLHSHVDADRRASLAIGMLSSRFMGHGYGCEALGLVLDHAFGSMGLHRIDLRVLATNARALRGYRDLGFVEEGRARQAAKVGDGWEDDILMGLLASDWKAAA